MHLGLKVQGEGVEMGQCHYESCNLTGSRGGGTKPTTAAQHVRRLTVSTQTPITLLSASGGID